MYLGQDIISKIKKKLLLQQGLIEELIVDDIKKIARRKQKVEHKINLFLSIVSKKDKQLASELKQLLRGQDN